MSAIPRTIFFVASDSEDEPQAAVMEPIRSPSPTFDSFGSGNEGDSEIAKSSNGWLSWSDGEPMEQPMEVVTVDCEMAVEPSPSLEQPMWNGKPIKVYTHRHNWKVTQEEKGKAPMVEEPQPLALVQQEDDPNFNVGRRVGKLTREVFDLKRKINRAIGQLQLLEQVYVLDKSSLDQMHDRISKLEENDERMRNILGFP